ncbi:MAG TPA: hypothetical protein VFE50_21820 [Cyclobacteriaceae bacterium]|nr:hypothetical protein [Cyclobacteriaceae bacterium]
MRLLSTLLLLIIPAAAFAQVDSAFLRGNWLKTDGSNAMGFGVFEKAACFNNATWKINSIDGEKITLSNDSKNIEVAFKKKDANTIEVRSGKEHIVLKKQRTFSAKYKPTKEKLQEPYVHPAEATISGVIYSTALKTTSLENRYVTVSYVNELTAIEELAFGDIDDEGRFTLKLQLYRPQLCEIQFNNDRIGHFFAQPGTSMVLAINTAVQINRENPDYDMIGQRISFMGDDATFNSLYQHFQYYSATKQFPDLKFSAKVHAGKSIGEKKAMIYEWHKIKEEQLMSEMGYVYPKKSTEARFTDYIRDEIRYTVAESLVSSFRDDWTEPNSSKLKLDSTDFVRIRSLYLADIATTDMNHASFHKFVRQYVSNRITLKTGGRMSYSINPQKMKDRVEKEYAPLLPATFVKSYRMIMDEIGTLNFQMDEKQLMDRYFNGSKEQMDYFEVMFKHIRSEMGREVTDTIEYETNLQLFPDPIIRYVANLKVLDDTGSEYKTPSIYRLELYKRYSRGGVGPWRMIDSLRRENALFTGLAGIGAKLNNRSIDDVMDETQWQQLLSKYKGRTIVFWMFSGRYTAPSAYSSLHELKKMKKYFEGKNVVFIKIILERSAEAQQHIMNYIQAFARNEEFHDVYRVLSNVSLNGLRNEAIGNQVLIYGGNGLVHHPEYFEFKYNDPRRTPLSLVTELERVLGGNGRYFEKYANQIFGMPFSRADYGEVFRWTRVYQSGRYQTYQYKEPKELDYRRPDSVFHQLIFRKKDSVIEQTLNLKKQRRPSARKDIYSGYEYKKQHVPVGTFAYTYDPEKFILTLMEKSAVRKKYRVVLITNQVMLLELLD